MATNPVDTPAGLDRPRSCRRGRRTPRRSPRRVTRQSGRATATTGTGRTAAWYSGGYRQLYPATVHRRDGLVLGLGPRDRGPLPQLGRDRHVGTDQRAGSVGLRAPEPTCRLLPAPALPRRTGRDRRAPRASSTSSAARSSGSTRTTSSSPVSWGAPSAAGRDRLRVGRSQPRRRRRQLPRLRAATATAPELGARITQSQSLGKPLLVGELGHQATSARPGCSLAARRATIIGRRPERCCRTASRACCSGTGSRSSGRVFVRHRPGTRH